MTLFTPTQFLLLTFFVISCKGIKIFPKTRENLLWYQTSNANTYVDYIKDIDDVLKEHSFDQYNNTNTWGPCVSSNSYSFSLTGPCIFLDLSEKLHETPEPYNSTTLPIDAPEHIRNLIRKKEDRHFGKTNVAYIMCSGIYPADEENIGPLQFFPKIAIDILPNTFSDRLIAVYFEKPFHYVIINVECRIWANFKNKEDLDKSVVKFELLID